MWNPFKKKNVKSKRSFAGAEYGRLVSDWITSGASLDSEINSSLTTLRNRTRELVRNNDYAKNAVREIRNNVVGRGFTFQSHIKLQRGDKLNEKLNKKIESEFARWAKKQNCNTAGKLSFTQIQQVVIGNVVESGEAIVRLVTQKFGDSRVPLALQVLDADMLDESYNGISEDKNAIRMGVEIDKWGRPVNYYFYAKHPGDYTFVDAPLERTNNRIKIPASEILHLFIPETEKQTRAVPWFASTLMRMRQMAGYEDAEVVAARATASLMGFIQTPTGELEGEDVVDNQRVTDFEPGVIKKLNPGETMNVPNISRPGGQFDPFMRLMLRGVAAGLGASYETISKDFSQTSYSSARQSILAERDNFRVIQDWFRENFHEVIFAKWLDMAVLSGAVSLANYESDAEMYYDSVRWIPRGWQWVDPAKEVAAFRESITAGFTTLTDVVSQSGNDFEEILSQRKRELDSASALGIVFDTNPEAYLKQNNPTPSKPDNNIDNAQ